MVSAILVNKKYVRLYISLLLLCFLMIPSFSMEGNPQAKKEQLLIYVNQATTMYKSKGKENINRNYRQVFISNIVSLVAGLR
ncbi:hypothetical protein KGI01_00930 [Kurthia gibsonii]|nr:hypothetical protein KGI01_00930 [Kurthia gibsonii]